MAARALLGVTVAAALALGGCKGAAQKEAERVAAAVDAFAASVPAGDPKEFVRTAPGYADKLKALEATREGLHPAPGSPSAGKLGTAAQWVDAARAEDKALEAAFQAELGPVEQQAHKDLALAVMGGPTRSADQMAAALAGSRVRVIVLWHGTGNERGFDEDHQNLPAPERRAVDPSAKFIVGYVQRVDGEGLTFVTERVTAAQKILHVAFYEMPLQRRLGVFTLKGEIARLPDPVPPAGTTLPGEKPPLVESLLRQP